jgi:hypothetical protein
MRVVRGQLHPPATITARLKVFCTYYKGCPTHMRCTQGVLRNPNIMPRTESQAELLTYLKVNTRQHF